MDVMHERVAGLDVHKGRLSTETKANRLAAQIAKLGYHVEIRPLPEAA
jgi:hypothetical protein